MDGLCYPVQDCLPARDLGFQMGCKCRPAGTGVGGRAVKPTTFRVTGVLAFAPRKPCVRWIARYCEGEQQDLSAITWHFA
jgi:hypothetical protein